MIRVERFHLVVFLTAVILTGCQSSGLIGILSPTKSDRTQISTEEKQNILAKAGTFDPAAFQKNLNQAIDAQSRSLGRELIKKIPAETLRQSLPWMWQNAPRFAPVYFYETADRLLIVDAKQAGLWLLTGQLRLTYDVRRCTDPSVAVYVAQKLNAFSRKAKKLGFADRALGIENYKKALEWDIAHASHRFDVLDTCLRGREAAETFKNPAALKIEEKYSDQPGSLFDIPKAPKSWVKPQSDFPRALAQARDLYRDAIAKGREHLRKSDNRLTKSQEKDILAKAVRFTPLEFRKNMIWAIQAKSRKLGQGLITLVPDETLSQSLPWMWRKAPQFAPIYFYEVAHRLLTIAPEKASLWILTGRLRLIYDTHRCTDRTVGGFVARLDYKFKQKARILGLIDLTLPLEDFERALKWDMANPPHEFPLRDTCFQGRRSNADGIKTQSDFPKAREQAREIYRKAISKGRERRRRDG